MKTVRINAGGKLFQTTAQTLLKYPKSPLSKLVPCCIPKVQKGAKKAQSSSEDQATEEIFLDVEPRVFERVLQFLRSGSIQLPTDDEFLRSSIVHQLTEWDLLAEAFPPVCVPHGEEPEEPEENVVRLPDVCVVQICDHMYNDQGNKRHAMTITYGADGFYLRNLCRKIRADLTHQISSSFWQCHQTNERAAFFVTTKIANASADLMTTSISQRVIEHTEKMGFHLTSSYVTLSPDAVHTSVRMLIHNFIFRRVRAPILEDADMLPVVVSPEEQIRSPDDPRHWSDPNFSIEPTVGPDSKFADRSSKVHGSQAIDPIWK